MIYSFDVFDTVITRIIGDPHAVFHLLGTMAREAGLVTVDPLTFASERLTAETTAKTPAKPHVWLVDAYKKLAEAISMSPAARDQVMAMELDLEMHISRPVESIRPILADARKQGQVIFVSDMYLPAEFVVKLLRKHGMTEPGDRVFVSCEHGCCKSDGKLFSFVASELKVSPKQITHYGNNRYSDLNAARRAGLKAVYVDDANPNRFESALNAGWRRSEGLASLLAGASRLTRLNQPGRSEHEKSLRVVAGGVIAPLLVTYVLWLFKRCEALGLKRLYFVSRDGEILLEIARLLKDQLKTPVELRYLYGSRRAWHLPGVFELSDVEFSWILNRSTATTLDVVLKRVGLIRQEVSEELRAAGLADLGPEELISPADIAKFRAVLLLSRVNALVLANAAKMREAVIAYMRQEGLLQDDQWAMVDIGWRGRLQWSLSNILRNLSRPPARGFYFGLLTAPDEKLVGPLEAFFFDGRVNREMALRMNELPTMMEVFTAARHGMVTGYTTNADGQLTPTLQAEKNSAVLSWGLGTIRQAVAEFTASLSLDQLSVNPYADCRDVLVSPVEQFLMNPTRAEAEAFGRFPVEDDPNDPTTTPLAEAIPWSTFLRSLASMGRGPGLSRWMPGSFSLSDRPIGWTLRNLRTLRRKILSRTKS